MINTLRTDFGNHPGQRKGAPVYRQRIGGAATGEVFVSIITPYYNTEPIFEETLVSVLAQSMQNWEWLIVDDGSSDQESVARLARLTKDDARIRVIRQQNAGPAAARNTAVAHSSGRYICLLDSDDMIEPTYLEKCVWFLESNPQFAFCNSYSVVFGDQQYLWTKGFETGKQHVHYNSGPPISVVRRSAFDEAGGFDASIRFGHEDWDFWLAMAKAGHWGYTLPEYLQWYRKRGNGRFEQIMRAGDVNAEFEAHMRQKYAGLEDRFPAPQRRAAEPYETVPARWSVHNPLQPNPRGRRIMVLVPWMVVGGADRVNLDLIEGLVKDGHDVTVCATLAAEHTWLHKFTELTPDVFVLPTFLQPADYPRFLGYLIESRQIDTVVVTGSTLGYQFLPYLRAVAPDTAFVDLNHVEEPHWLNGGHPRFGVGYQDMLDLNVVTTGRLAGWMADRGADPARIRVLYTGVRAPATPRSPESLRAARAALGIADDAPLIIFAGRISEQKRPAMLAEILRAARDAGLRFRALIIGEGPLRPALEGLLDRYGLRSWVRMAGALPHQQWLEALVGADILLMPSQYEGISVALLEAMAAGVTPVVANVGGQGEIVAPDCGYLIDHGEGEVQVYVRALSGLLGQPEHLAATSAACQQLIASRFSWAQTIRNFEQILDEAHAAKAKRLTQFSVAAGIELATLALEHRRVNEAMDGLWAERDHLQQQLHQEQARIAELRAQATDTERRNAELLAAATAHRTGGAISLEPQAAAGVYVARWAGLPRGTAAVVRVALLACRSRLGRLVLDNRVIRGAGRVLLAVMMRGKGRSSS